MKKASRNIPPPLDSDVPSVPLSVIVKYRHRSHQKAVALGYGIAVAMIFLAFAMQNGIVFWFGFGVAIATRDLGQRVCRKQGCRAFARRGW